MNLLDQHFEEALRDLPQKKLSWFASRRIKKMLKQREREMKGISIFWTVAKQLVVVPVALLLVISTVFAYAFYSPSIVQGDLLYVVKNKGEEILYPNEGNAEQRMTYHLWLSNRRYSEAEEILHRRENAPVAFLPAAFAQEEEISNSDSLDDLFVETLNRATQQVDLALVVTQEMRDPLLLKNAKEKIEEAIFRHKDFLKKKAPLLKKIKLKQTRKARKLVTPTPIATTISLPLLPMFTPALEIPLVVSNTEDFLTDRIAFQEDRIKKLSDEIDVATRAGLKTVQPKLNGNLETFLEEESVGDQLTEKAVMVHYEKTKKMIQEELQAMPTPPRGKQQMKEALELKKEKAREQQKKKKEKELKQIEKRLEKIKKKF